MTATNAKAQEKAIEALIGASLRAPGKEAQITDEEIARYVEQHVTLSSEDKAALEDSKPDVMQAIGNILRGNPQEDKECVKGQHSKGIYYRRAAFDAYVVQALADDINLGRTKIEKITHLTEYHFGIDFEREPLRDAAGPVDYQSRRKVESLASKLQWYFVRDAGNRLGKKYVPGESLSKALPTAERLLGTQKSAVDGLIELMRPLDTKCCEIIATLYAAWNDLLLRGKSPAEEEIVREATENWHAKKLTIPLQRWTNGLKWMREKQLVPRGSGKPVPRAKK